MTKAPAAARTRATLSEWIGRLLLYGASGVVNTLVGLGVIAALDLGLGVNSQIANALGYAAGLTSALVLNRVLVFRGRETGGSGPRFLLAAAACFGLNQLVLVAGLAVFSTEPLARLAAQGLGMATYTVALFLLCQFWVFPHRRSAGAG